MHITHKVGEIMEIDLAGQNAYIINTDTYQEFAEH